MHILSCAPALRVCVMKLAVGWHLKRTDTSFHLAKMAHKQSCLKLHTLMIAQMS